MFKTRFISMLVLLAAVVTGAVAQNYTITLPSVSNGSVAAKVNDTPVTSAAAGATVSLVATPDAGYRLKSISGTFKGGPVETLTNSGGTVNGTYFSLSASDRVNTGWNLKSNNTITITSRADGLKIDKAEFNKQWQGQSFDIGDLTVSPGTLSLNGNTITVSSVNNNSFTLTGTGNNANGCRVNSVTIYGSGIVVDRTQTITSTDAPNVKTFTMPEADITISAEFERVNVSGVSLSQTEAAMTLGGETLTLTATVAPDDAADKTVTWTSSNDAVATVDANGVVTAVSAGTATITATATNGTDDTSDDKTATCTVTVTQNYKVTLADGTEDSGNWTISPANPQPGDVVTITYGGTKKVKSVKAVKKAAVIKVTIITLNKTETTINVGSTETLSVTAIDPSNATDKTYTWNSDNTAVATVDADGVVTAKAAGTANITATANDGSGVTATCAVTVIVPVSSITINNAPTEALFVNSKGTLTATVLPDNATEKTVTWSSSDPDYVSINATTGEYEVKGTKGYGSATITASAGGKTATCTITGKVIYTSLSVGTVLHTGDTFYTGSTVQFKVGNSNASFTTTNGVITVVEDNGYYKFKRGSNGTMPNWTAFRVQNNTDGIYITGGSGTSSDRFTLAVHTK